LNRRYRESLIPFVICARLNKRTLFPKPFRNGGRIGAEEIETALGEIFKIAELRLRDLIP
jgi:2-oxo-4-hydroxy-4-carboxy--5-ureidoimidazoline (OHCU) decarboxylase